MINRVTKPVCVFAHRWTFHGSVAPSGANQKPWHLTPPCPADVHTATQTSLQHGLSGMWAKSLKSVLDILKITHQIYQSNIIMTSSKELDE